MKRAALLVLPSLLVGIGLAARGMAARALEAFTGYETPFAFSSEGVPAAPPTSPRVVVVLVDGLGLGASRGMTALDALRTRGADYDCAIGLPSLSLPGRAVIFTGAWQEVHGQMTNQKPRRLKVDHLFQKARERGLETALAAGETVHTLFAPHVTRWVAYPKEPDTAPYAHYERSHQALAPQARALLATRAGLTLLEVNIVDEAAHSWGTSSDEHRRAVALADDEIGRIAAALDLGRDTLVVTADHGHVPWGGHGGPEPTVMQVPLVLAGAGVRSAVTGAARQVDIAPTIATLLGLGVPASNQGRPLLDALTLEGDERLDALRRVVAQRRRFVAHYAARVRALDDGEGTSLAGPRRPDIPDEAPAALQDEVSALALLDRLDAEALAVKEERIRLDARLRSRYAALLVLVPALVVGGLAAAGAFTPRELGRAALCGAAGVALYHLALPAAGLAYSISAVNKDEWMEPFFRRDMALAVVAAALGAGLSLVWSGGAGSLVDRARQTWLTLALFVQVFIIKIALIYWQQDVVLRWHLPDIYWGFGFYLDVLAVMAVGLASPAYVLVAWAAGKLPHSRAVGVSAGGERVVSFSK